MKRRRPRWMRFYRGWLWYRAADAFPKDTAPDCERVIAWEPWRGKYRLAFHSNIRDMVRTINRDLRMRALRQGETPL